MPHFCCEKAAFFKYFGLHLDLDLTFEKMFWAVVGLGPSFKKSGLDLDRKIWQSASGFVCDVKIRLDWKKPIALLLQ